MQLPVSTIVHKICNIKLILVSNGTLLITINKRRQSVSESFRVITEGTVCSTQPRSCAENIGVTGTQGRRSGGHG